ncbi:hypothetical protein A3C18_00660 [Candidatus Kaiserbacteria bacterium RIFCSPHIGHO2_02_FULL_54_11b]|uniref:Uncharacterized protein n=1 Tax=Candidatus Kaiserbacteria bacterium RIFCSPHIGHO2_02_FULL_54_11b TaxID=1798494 RepID=A0A1F6DTI1_9BACT|nr:MAG: hypothetical protein A3C18_00660 [Candidatus Kaiserbacteria bacterium RIFCSPHIGHO2_02_FULL_54_11b]
MKNQTIAAAHAHILRIDGIASENKPRCIEYKSQTTLFPKMMTYVVRDMASVDPFAMIVKIWGYSANPDTIPVTTANLSIQWL